VTVYLAPLLAVLHLFYNLCNRLFCTVVVDVIFVVWFLLWFILHNYCSCYIYCM